MHILDATTEFPPEVAKAVSAPAGRPPFDGVRLAAELATVCGVRTAPTAPAAVEWANGEADRLRPLILRSRSCGAGLQTIWRHLSETPAEWRTPARVGGLILHAVAWRLGIDADFVRADADGNPPELMVADADADRVLSPLDGCLRVVHPETITPLRPRAVVKAALADTLSLASGEPGAKRVLAAARLAAFLSPADARNWVRVAEACLDAGDAGSALTLADRVGGRSDELHQVRRAAGDEIARRN